MPVDRRAFRDELRAARNHTSVGFDFDCTITVKHFYKCMAWGFFTGNMGAHPHYQEMVQWITDNAPDLPKSMPPEHRGQGQGLEVSVCLDIFERSDAAATKRLLREFFLGGEERIAELTAFFTELEAKGVAVAILTAGIASSVSQMLAIGAPEWLPFFPTCRVHDTSFARHRVAGIAGLKMLQLRDLIDRPRGFLVDDSLVKDYIPPWVVLASGVKPLDWLPYEGPGLQTEDLERIKAELEPPEIVAPPARKTAGVDLRRAERVLTTQTGGVRIEMTAPDASP